MRRKKPKTRNDLWGMFNDMGLVGEAAELGVLKGRNAKSILRNWQGKKLYLVDAWHYGRRVHYRKILNLAEADKRIEIKRGYTSDIANEFLDESLDWIYIDASHDFANICADLLSWYRTVKKGGVLAGHDYRDDEEPHSKRGNCKVKSAVDLFSCILDRQIEVTDEILTSWWFVK